MSSFLMGYPLHIQSPMHGGSSMDPKFPPSTDDYHHSHHHHYHNGYGHNVNSMSSNMAPPPPPPLQNNDYTNHQNVSNGMHTNNSNNYDYSPTISGHFYQHSYNTQMHHVPAPPPPAQQTNNTYSPPNNNAYYGSYYGSNNGHQMMDLPLQCPSTEPTNTVLGLQELGEFFMGMFYENSVTEYKKKYLNIRFATGETNRRSRAGGTTITRAWNEITL